MRRRDPAMLAALAEVQAARQIAADAALAEARAAAAEADLAARGELDAAEGMWRDLLARPGFAPELARGMAHVLVLREGDADAATAALRVAGDQHLDRQQAWRVAETQKRTALGDLKAARRAAARHREERRGDALADRVTHDWSRA